MQWTQTLDIPIGQGMPAGTKAELLGFEIGDTHARINAKIEDLIAGLPEGQTGSAKESSRVFQVPLNNDNFVETKFVSQTDVRIDKGASDPEFVSFFFTAPSSGAQLYAISRDIYYNQHEDQPRISDVLTRVTEKFGVEPFKVLEDGATVTYRYLFDDGRAVPAGTTDANGDCGYDYFTPFMGKGEAEDRLQFINATGKCDIALDVRFDIGISDDRAKVISFGLYDAARARRNFEADFQYFRDYVTDLANGTAGNSPKL